MDKGSKAKRIAISLEVKKRIVSTHESGVSASDLATQFGMARSTVGTIIKNKEAIKGANVAKGVKTLTRKRTQTMEEMEKMLLIWITEKQLAGDSVSRNMIRERALQLHADLIKNAPGGISESESFKASPGWFHKFKMRSGIRTASANKLDADRFVLEFEDYVEAEGFLPQQVFNCDETGFFWKKMPRETYTTKEERALPGQKPMKDILTLLFCANASGDLKLKPLVVYHSENPGAFKKNKVIKSELHVMQRANSRAWLTRQFFMEWVHDVFGPSVRKYLQDNNLPLKCLLVLDHDPGHPPGLQEKLMEEFGFIKVKFLPPNVTPLIQPMEQKVISNFKKLYTKALFQRCFEVTSDTELTAREFWKNHFNILHYLDLIDTAWRAVTQKTLKSAWRKLWPEAVPEDVCEAVEEAAPIVEEIVSLGKSMGLQVSSDDVEELVEDPKTELTTEELQDILMMEEEDKEEEEEEEEKEEKEEKEQIRESASTALIQEMCAKWAEVQNFVEKICPDEATVNHATNTFNDNVMSHVRQILKRRKKQMSERGEKLARKRSSESEPGISGAKRSRAGEESPAVILEKDHRTPEEKSPLQIIEGDPSIQVTNIISTRSGSAPPWQQLRESQKGRSLCCVVSPASSAPSALCYLLGDVKISSGQPLQVPITFEEVAVFFTEEEWALLDPGQRALHKEVMEEIYGMLASLSKDALFP